MTVWAMGICMNMNIEHDVVYCKQKHIRKTQRNFHGEKKKYTKKTHYKNLIHILMV